MNNIPNDLTDLKEDERFADAREVRDSEASVPDGYITVELSTKGKLYAPAKFHIRNFTAEDLLGMALTDDDTLPIKVIEMLNTLIYEDDIDVGKFHEDEVIETLFVLYKTFYTDKLKDVIYKLQESDWKYLQDTNGGPQSDAYLKLKASTDSGDWKPKIDIDLNTIGTYSLPDDFAPKAHVKNNKTGFTCVYGLPRYGDVRDISDFINIIYAQEEESLTPIIKKVEYIREQKAKKDRNEPITYDMIPVLTKAEERAYSDYLMRRNLDIMRATRAAHLLEYRGKDVSGLPIEKKLTLADDPELDLRVYTKISNALDGLKIGLQKEIKVKSPITNKEIVYPFTFRLFDLLQAISTTEPDGIDVVFK